MVANDPPGQLMNLSADRFCRADRRPSSSVMTIKLYVFDADATLRRCTVPDQPCPNRPGEWEALPGVREKLATIDWSRHGFGIASNQAGIALGYLTIEMAYEMLCDLTTGLLERWPPVGSLQICPHAPNVGCDCRKPMPAMLQRIMRVYGYGPSGTLFVGDLPTDEQCAANAGCSFAWAWDFFGGTRETWTAMLQELADADRKRIDAGLGA
jgi:D-glycero-D-manno-heptose 1,7-bisphosphate phosphatase